MVPSASHSPVAAGSQEKYVSAQSMPPGHPLSSTHSMPHTPTDPIPSTMLVTHGAESHPRSQERQCMRSSAPQVWVETSQNERIGQRVLSSQRPASHWPAMQMESRSQPPVSRQDRKSVV